MPLSLKVFLLTLATLDDLGAIVIIALFYTSELSVLALMLAGCALAVLFAFNRLHISRAAPYILVGLLLWTFVLEFGRPRDAGRRGAGADDSGQPHATGRRSSRASKRHSTPT